MVDETLLRQILLNATAKEEFFKRLRKRRNVKTETIIRLLERVCDYTIEQRDSLDKTIGALLLLSDTQRIDRIKELQKQMTTEEFGRLSRVKGMEELKKNMDYIIDELGKQGS
jgi:hypothetical protein